MGAVVDEQSEALRAIFAYSISYPAADAATSKLLDLLSEQASQPTVKMGIRRHGLTAGSSVYVMSILQDDQRLDVLRIELRDIDQGRTYFEIDTAAPYRDDPGAPGYVRLIQSHILDWLVTNEQIYPALIEATKVPAGQTTTEEFAAALAEYTSRAKPVARGAPRTPLNEWARAQVHDLGRSRSEVYKEYVQRLPRKPKTPAEEERAKARFRGAIKRTKNGE